MQQHNKLNKQLVVLNKVNNKQKLMTMLLMLITQ